MVVFAENRGVDLPENAASRMLGELLEGFES
ncbi:Uncharacterised protein [Mycobacterium tuberculosis]|nr:Uncharacterised protein [Mycobacterium tuberculosis]